MQGAKLGNGPSIAQLRNAADAAAPYLALHHSHPPSHTQIKSDRLLEQEADA